MNRIENSFVEFSCISESDLIVYLVNGSIASEQAVINKGFIQSVIEDVYNTNFILRNMSTTSLLKYNNTEVVCRAVTFHSDMTFSKDDSDIAVLRVQGIYQ